MKRRADAGRNRRQPVFRSRKNHGCFTFKSPQLSSTRTNSVLTRRDYLTGIAATSLIATSGCASPYGFGELNNVAQTIAHDPTEDTPYDYRVDANGSGDPGNEIYVGWSEGMMNVSGDAAFAESTFCTEEYLDKELQQDPERMEKKKNEASDNLLTENPCLDDAYFYSVRDTMRDLEPDESTSSYASAVDFSGWKQLERVQ